MESETTQRSYLKDPRQGEKVVAVIRHHWWVLLREVIGLAFLFIVPVIVVPFVLASSNVLSGAVAGAGTFFFAFWALIIWHLLFTRWTDYYYDMWIITNSRIVDIDQQGLFRRDIATLLDLDHIQDINTKTAGVIPTLLGFGNVEFQTAGSKREFEITEVPSPQRIEKIVRAAQAERGRTNMPVTSSDAI